MLPARRVELDVGAPTEVKAEGAAEDTLLVEREIFAAASFALICLASSLNALRVSIFPCKVDARSKLSFQLSNLRLSTS